MQICRLWCGFFLVGTLAGEVATPQRSFKIAFAVLIPMLLLDYAMPLALTLSIDQNLNHFDPGLFAHVAGEVAGPWLKVIITVAAIVSQIGLTNGGLIVADESLQSFLLRHNSELFDSFSKSPSRFIRWCFNTEFRIAPIIALFNCSLLALMINVPYDFLVVSSMLVCRRTLCKTRYHKHKIIAIGQPISFTYLPTCLPTYSIYPVSSTY